MDKISMLIDQLVNVMVSFGPFGGFLLVLLESVVPPLPLGAIVGLNMLSFGNVF